MQVSFDATEKAQTLVDLLRRRAEAEPERIAYRFLVDGDEEQRELTYAALDGQARAIAAVLRQTAKPGTRAVLLHPPGLEFIAALFGCLYAGILAVPAYAPHRNRTDPRILQILTDCEAELALTTSRHLETAERFAASAGLENLRTIATDAIDGATAPSWEAHSADGDSPALLQYTSGSTVAPKGVMVSHANILTNSRDMAALMQHTPDSASVSWLPHFHDMGLVYGVMQPMYAGFTGCLMSPAAFLQQPIRWLRAISRFRALSSGAPNFAWDLCVARIDETQKSELDLGSWQVAFSGAETVRWKTLDRFARTFAPCGFRREALCPAYGLAEATLRVTSSRPRRTGPSFGLVDADALRRNRAVSTPEETAEARSIVNCGDTSPGTRVVVVCPDSRRKLDDREVGEIWVAGPGVALGYWNRPDQSRETFEARTADGDGQFLRTGDLGYLDRDQLHVTGRLKDLIIIRGLNHHPHDIERTVESSHAALRADCGAAFSVEHESEEALVIVQELDRQARDPDVKSIVDGIVEAVTEQHGVQPHAIVLIKHGSCPKTTSGKIQRHAARSAYLEGRLRIVARWQAERSAAPVAAATVAKAEGEARGEEAIRAWLIAKVAERVGAAPSTIDSDRAFVQLGVGSAEALTLIGELEQWMGRKLSPVIVYNYPNIDALAQYLSQPAGVER